MTWDPRRAALAALAVLLALGFVSGLSWASSSLGISWGPQSPSRSVTLPGQDSPVLVPGSLSLSGFGPFGWGTGSLVSPLGSTPHGSTQLGPSTETSASRASTPERRASARTVTTPTPSPDPTPTPTPDPESTSTLVRLSDEDRTLIGLGFALLILTTMAGTIRLLTGK